MQLSDEQIDGMADHMLAEAVATRFGEEYRTAVYGLNKAHELETRLAEMGLVAEYVVALCSVLGFEYDEVAGVDLFKVAHASSRDRCRAALRAVRDAQQREQADAE